MIRRPLVPVVLAAAALLGLNGCTSGGSTSPASSSLATRGGSSAPSTPVPSRSAPSTSAATTCSASSTALTFRRHTTVVAGEEFGLPPGGKKSTPYHLPVITVVRAQAPGLGTGAGLTGTVGRHWHTMAASLGSTTAHHDETRVGLHDSSKDNEFYVVYRFVHVFTGEYSSQCGGAGVTGRYTTFGPLSTVIVGCGDKIRGRLDRLGYRLCS